MPGLFALGLSGGLVPSTSALLTLRNQILPDTLGKVPGVSYAEAGDTAGRYDDVHMLHSSLPAVFAFVAVLAFVLAFGVAKALTNLAAGGLADRVGRRRLLIAGWAFVAVLVFMLVYYRFAGFVATVAATAAGALEAVAVSGLGLPASQVARSSVW